MRSGIAGYTLIEILLVLALFIITAAVVAPSILEGNDRSKLEDAADKLVEMWSRARLDAVAEGQMLLFQGELGGSVARVQSPGGVMELEPVAGQAATPAHELQLDSVVFRSLTIAEPAGSEPVFYAESVADAIPVVVFRPDGATSDAEALLEHAGGLQLKVVLRGMTGAVRVEEVETQE